MSDGDTGEQNYVMAEVALESERSRLEKLEQLHDAPTARRLDAIGVGLGWRCVEVGAGAGSISPGRASIG